MGPFAEFENSSENSKYPFSAGCSLLDDGGNRLPDDFMLDVSVCLWSSSAPWLSSLSGGVGVFSAGGSEIASFSYSGPGPAQVVDLSTGRTVGFVVLGRGASGFEEHVFDSGAAVLCPSCFCLFSPGGCVVSIASDFDGKEIAGNVRIAGKNGVYVTKKGPNKLRIDIIGEPTPTESCCSDAIYGFVVYGVNCPILAGVPIQYPSSSQSTVTIPGVVALKSSLSASAACGKIESVVQQDGTIGKEYCDSVSDLPQDTACIPSFGPFVIPVSNGCFDFVPFSAPGEGGSAVSVRTEKAGASSLSSVSALSDPSFKSLASATNSGTVFLGLKGRI